MRIYVKTNFCRSCWLYTLLHSTAWISARLIASSPLKEHTDWKISTSFLPSERRAIKRFERLIIRTIGYSVLRGFEFTDGMFLKSQMRYEVMRLERPWRLFVSFSPFIILTFFAFFARHIWGKICLLNFLLVVSSFQSNTKHRNTRIMKLLAGKTDRIL